MENMSDKDLGRYRILEQIGEGGMATVYKAMDTLLEREVAIKIIRRSALPPDQLGPIMNRFKREAKTLAKLAHSNIVKVYDFGDYDGSPYLVLEYLPGGTLKQRLALLNGAPMPWNEVIQILLPIAAALEFAHGQDMIHRDVKPSNILISQTGQPMLSDFGIAKLLGSEETSSLTASGIGVGTPEYMAPEQWTGKVSAQTDVYSLGVILYEMVTGRKPYEADTPAAILLKQATQPLPSPRKFSKKLPGGCEEILLKALAPKPENRYPDMKTFSEALKQLEMVPKTKRAAPEVRKATPASLESDFTTIDRFPAKAVPTKSSKTTKYVKEAKSAPVKKSSLRGLWISLGSLAGVIILASAAYIIDPNIRGLPFLAAPVNATPTTTATEIAIIPTSTPEPTAVPPTQTPTSTATAVPTPTKPVIRRTIISIENGMDFAKLQEISSDSIDQIRWSTDNRYLLVASPNGINIYDAGNFRSVGSINPPVREVYFSYDGTLVAFFETTKTLQVQKIADNTILCILPIPPHNGSISAVVFSQDNTLIAVGMSTGMIDVWKVADKSLVATLDAPNTYVRTMAFSPDGTELAAGSGSPRNTDYSLRIWNLKTKVADHFVDVHKSPITYLFYFPDGDILASGSNDGFIYLWQVKDAIRMQTLLKAYSVNYLGGIEGMAFSWDASLLAYSIPYQNSHAILLTQASDGAVVKIITNLPGPIPNMAFSEDNTALATGYGTNIQIWGVP